MILKSTSRINPNRELTVIPPSFSSMANRSSRPSTLSHRGANLEFGRPRSSDSLLSRTAREPSNRTPYFCLPKRDEGLQSALTTNEVVTLSVSVLLSRRNCDWSFQSEVGDIGNYIVEYLLVAAAWIENPNLTDWNHLNCLNVSAHTASWAFTLLIIPKKKSRELNR